MMSPSDLSATPLLNAFQNVALAIIFFFCARARCLSAGLRYLRLTRLPRHDRGPVPGGNRSAASCPCTVLRRASYHYATRSPSLAIITERQNKLNFSDQCQTKFLLPKSQDEFYDLLPIPSCTSPAKTKAKHMENGLIFHVTIQIQILIVFSVQGKYSEDEKYIVVGFRHLQ